MTEKLRRLEEVIAENKKLRSAISFWTMARFPEMPPSPTDIEAVCRAQEALETAELTLCNIVKETGNG